MTARSAAALLALLVLGGCARAVAPVVQSLPPLPFAAESRAAPRINGQVGAADIGPAPQFSLGQPQPLTMPGVHSVAGGDISLDIADTDIRAVVAQILGGLLHANYTIDPGVRGTVTLHTPKPIATGQLLSVLQVLLAQNNVTLAQADGIYRVMLNGTAGAPVTTTGLASSSDVAGTTAVPLHYASAEELAKVLQPFAGTGTRLTPDPARDALLISGDPTTRRALIELAQTFDTDLLAGQSYALFPATSGDAKDFAAAMQDALRGHGALAGVIRVVPLPRLSSVLVIANQPRYIDDARRVYALVERSRRQTVRSWHVYYLQNSHANDTAYVLQQAFTPGDVTAQPSQPAGQTAPGTQQIQAASPGQSLSQTAYGGGSAGGWLLGLGGGANGLGGAFGTASAAAPPQGGGTPAGLAVPAGGNASLVNPLLGGLDQSAGAGEANTMRIIPNPQNNALLIYATPSENDTIDAMLRKVDILPLQVRIDAIIAEVTLNNQLQYGTQFFFRAGGINGILNNGTGPVGSPASTVLDTTFPGFILSGKGQGGAPRAISALQAVTTVHVLSSPEILVLDNQPARLQVGDLVPYLMSTSQSTIASNAPVLSSIGYEPTGVIMQVTPRVNSGGLVTLDISQEVSDVDTTTPPSSTIDSPTFPERNITSRVVVQDGQTIGLAGLIRDSVTRGNSGIPWLKDIPLLGLLAGAQNNQRTRTELLVLITPHVVQDQRRARELTEDLREQLINAAAVPDELKYLRSSGSDDPNRRLRQNIKQQLQ